MTGLLQVTKHFDYLTPFEEAENDDELAKIMRLKYPKACSILESDAAFFARMVDGVRKFEAWRVVGFDTFEDFCRKELGQTLEEVDAIVTGVKALQERGVEKITLADVHAVQPMPVQEIGVGKAGPGRGKKTDDNVIRFSLGNSKSYLAARLKRDHPDIVARIDEGEFRSIHAAAVAAGISKPTATIRVDTPDAAIRALARRFSKAELRRAVEALS